MTLPHKPNDRLRAARLRMKSLSGSGHALSRRELADLVNAHLAARDVRWLCMDAAHIGKYERGEHIWPQREYRQALRAVLGVSSDADLGFHTRRSADTGAVSRTRSGRGGVTVAALAMRSEAATVASAASAAAVGVPDRARPGVRAAGSQRLAHV